MSKLLRKCANFGYQEREICIAFVFGTQEENIIIVLENDEVLAFGKNQKGCLGAGVEGEVDEFKRIENLCGRNIEGFEYGGFIGAGGELKFSIFAISRSGGVFSWGENCDGQLGLGTKEYTKVPTKISGSLEHKKVVQVACGGLHTLALTSEGEVYAFGWNWYGQLGLGTKDNQSLPQRVGGLLHGTIVTSVACQKVSSFALLQSGKICAWGNLKGKLGSSSTSDKEYSPCKLIGLERVVITQIVCGGEVTLALSDDGVIYSWGIYEGQPLANWTSDYVEKKFIKVSTDIGRVKEIAATHYGSHPCAAITEKKQVFIWGNCKGKFVEKPILTSFSSLDEVFADAAPPVTIQEFQLKKRQCSIIKRLQEAFDKPETADFVFIVEETEIHVHKIILILGSNVFKNLFLGDWKDSCLREQIVENYSYDAFYSFLKYFYTGEVDFTPEHALDVYAVAHFYLVSDLLNECEKIIKSGLTMQNVAAVYEKAILFGAKDLCECCFQFCKKNWFGVMHSFESDECKREVFLEVYRWAANGKKN
ncbi:RCC1 and BTB domain-containing protein 1-like [Cloeon dipterum]|uniref:RCC1 and BTB domain-containing protein 1-like n=1 Tax=Cloeon dipterum TaxID=197152 RepID=UPI00321FC11C